MNPFDILKNAQAIKDQFGKMQEELKDIEVTGSSGGGLVKITMNGQLEVQKVEIDPIAVDPRDVQMLQDLVVSAFRQASSNAQEAVKEKMGPLMGGMNLPGMGL